jgi:hypothetical protein
MTAAPPAFEKRSAAQRDDNRECGAPVPRRGDLDATRIDVATVLWDARCRLHLLFFLRKSRAYPPVDTF